MTRLFGYIRRYWLRYAFGICCTIATAALLTTIPRLSGEATNAIERGNYSRLVHLTALMVALALVMGVTRWFSRFVIFNCGRDIEYDLRDDLFAHLCRLSADFYQRIKTGDLMSRMINDLGNVRMMVGMGIISLSNTPVTFLLALAFMISLSPRLTLAAMLPYAALFFQMRWLLRSLMARSLKVQEGLAAIGSKVQESLSGIHMVKAYALEDFEGDRFREINQEYNEQGLALARLRGAMMPMIKGTVGTSVMIVIIYGGTLVRADHLKIGDIVAFMGFLGMLAWPTVSLGWTLSIYQRGKASMKRLEEIFAVAPQTSVEGPEERLTVTGAIEWANVSFSYFPDQGADATAAAAIADGNGSGGFADRDALDGDGDEARTAVASDSDEDPPNSIAPAHLSAAAAMRHATNGSPPHRPYALTDINVKVPAGGKLAIVGRTGAGKSTMAKLLTRLIEPTRGRVLLDGRDIRELSLKALRKTVGMVPQDPGLFSDTIARNIAFGRVDSSHLEIEKAARIAGLDGDIAVMPHGLDTIVGERGTSLSGGQKQRVTIARLLNYDPTVVVLDDALSSVDTETEQAVLHSLDESVKGRTTIVVAHRASTVRDADEIIVLEDGRIAERGTHEELMAQQGIYAELFRRQLLEEELARY